jgi:hypothetical protein
VTPVTQAPARTRSPARHLTLNSDGKRHPFINAAAAYTVAAGLASFIIGMINTASLAGTILGGTGFIVGLIGQMLSVTRAERMVLVVGIVASFIGAGLGFAHGGY